MCSFEYIFLISAAIHSVLDRSRVFHFTDLDQFQECEFIFTWIYRCECDIIFKLSVLHFVVSLIIELLMETKDSPGSFGVSGLTPLSTG